MLATETAPSARPLTPLEIITWAAGKAVFAGVGAWIALAYMDPDSAAPWRLFVGFLCFCAVARVKPVE